MQVLLPMSHPSQNCLGCCLVLRAHLSLEDKVLEAIAPGANKFDLDNDNHTVHTDVFCGLCHFCVLGDLGWR